LLAGGASLSSMAGWPEPSTVDGPANAICVVKSKSGVAPGGTRSPGIASDSSFGQGTHARTPGACSTASTARESTESGTTRLNCIVGPTATVKFVIPMVLRRVAKTVSAVSRRALLAPTRNGTTADAVCVGGGVACDVG